MSHAARYGDVTRFDLAGGVVHYHVPARSVVIVSTRLTHRDPAAWPNPAGFDPHRFLGVAQRFTFDLVPGADLTPDPTVTLRPLHGLPMTIHRRT